MQKSLTIFLSLLCVTLFAACGAKKKEISQLAQLQATQHMEAAQRELSLRSCDFTKVEKSLAEASKLNPANDLYWLELGKVRAHLKNVSGARDAYKQSLSVCDDALKQTPENPEYIARKIRVLVLLSRTDDARAVLAKGVKEFPKNAIIQQLNQQKIVDIFANDPQMKNLSTN